MKLQILIQFDATDEHREQILAAAPEAELLCVGREPEEDALLEAARRADIWLGHGLTKELLPHARRLKWVQTTSAGVDSHLFPELIASDVRMTNASGMHAETISDHVFMLMLALGRGLPEMQRSQRERVWKRPAGVRELAGQVLAVIGLGGIGREVARRGKDWGMRVAGTRRAGSPLPFVDHLYKPSETVTALAEADFAVVACALTDETRGLIGKAELAALGSDGYIINIARGAVIDQDAMIAALRDGVIAGAGLDVFDPEPLPEDSPLWDFPNVIITPHLAGSQSNYMGRALNIFCENLQRFQAGKPFLNEVDKTRGY